MANAVTPACELPWGICLATAADKSAELDGPWFDPARQLLCSYPLMYTPPAVPAICSPLVSKVYQCGSHLLPVEGNRPPVILTFAHYLRVAQLSPVQGKHLIPSLLLYTLLHTHSSSIYTCSSLQKPSISHSLGSHSTPHFMMLLS